MTEAVLLTGGLGSGKTTVAMELGEILGERGLLHAVIDLDWLCWIGPDVTGPDLQGLLTDNLRAVWANFAAAGARHLVMARALLEPSHAEAVRRALPGVDVTVIRLAVGPETRRLRLSGRDSGTVLAGHLAEAEHFERLIAGAGVESVVLTNDGRSVRETALAVLDRWTGQSR
jgi:adenylylsulfate kinase